MTQTPAWRVVIADDEPAARRGVRQLLARFPDFGVVAECRDGNEALSILRSAEADVLFLDIQMPGIDGFEVARRARDITTAEVIFLTAYNQFALEAFEAEAIDYLVKPVNEIRFGESMARLTKRLDVSSVRRNGVFVPSARGGVMIPLDRIEWIEAADNYARLWCGTRSHLVRQSLDKLDDRLRSRGFVRAHRRAIVRIASVRALETDDHGETHVRLLNGLRVPVSRRRRAELRKRLRMDQ